MSKKVWILNHYAVPPTEASGTRHYDFARELHKRGYDVTIFASSYNHFTKEEKLKSNETFKQLSINGVKFIWIKTRPLYKDNGIKRILNMLSYSLKMVRLYKKFDKPDIVIGSSVHLFACLAAYYICNRTNANFICEIRDLWPQTLIDMGAITQNHPLAIFFRCIEKFVYKKSKKIITLLPGAYKYITKFNIDREKIVYIPNGVDIKKFDNFSKNTSIEIDSKLNNMLDSSFCCLYTGSHGIANCLKTIIDAAWVIQNKGYDNIKFIFVGDGPEKKRLIEYAKQKEINNILFYNSVSKNFISKILDKAKINLISMHNINLYKYGISLNKLFDYMCSGKPIVFSGNVYNDIVKKANAGITVPPENPEAMAEAIIKLYNMSKEERDALGLNGRRYVEENHSIPILVDKLENLFNEILGTKH